MKLLQLAVSVPVLALTMCSVTLAQETASDTDKAFVAKVSQGGEYEVEASKLALGKAMAQDVKDLAYAEVHDHELVGHKLKSISATAQVPIEPKLNAEFTEKLNHLRSLSGKEFDDAYIESMKEIHDKDEKLFAQESMDGSGLYKGFAAETDLIVKRHIGALHGA